MRAAVTSHDGNFLLREDRSTLSFSTGSFSARKKLKGSPVVVSVATAKVEERRRSWTGAEGSRESVGPLYATPSTPQTSRSGVRLHKLRFEELWISMIVINRQFGKFSWFMLCRLTLTDVRHAPSEPPATLEEPLTDRHERVGSAPAAHCAWLSSTAFLTKNSLLSIICYEKVSQVFKEKEFDKRSAVKSCQAGGSGEGESSRVALHETCMGVPVHTGTRIHWCPSNFFWYESQGEGGSPRKFFGNTDLKKLQKLRTTPKCTCVKISASVYGALLATSLSF